MSDLFSTMRMKCVALLIIFFVLAHTSLAGSDRARITGTVVDPADAKVTDARVVLRDKTGLAVYETRTDAEGAFVFTNVSPGRYTLFVEAEGFALNERPVIEITASDAQSGAGKTTAARLEVAAIADRVVVSATRTASISSELGGSVSVIGSETLELSNRPTITESLRVVPGLVVAQTGGRGGITSIFSRGGESDYNKVLIDGVPVNASGGSFDFGSLTPENLDRIEVARGPRSALFGSDAMTGVIQLFTRRGSTSEPEFELTGEGGSYDFHRETARLSGARGRLDYSAAFGFQSTGGRFENSDFINRTLSSNLGLQLSSDVALRITSRWNNNTLGVPGPTALLFADPDQRQKHRDLTLSSAIDVNANSRWHHTARLIYSEFDTFNFDRAAQDLTAPERPPLAPGSFFPDFAFSFIDHQKRAGVHYQTTASLGATNLLTAGIDYEHESAVFTDDFSRVSPSRDNLGIYVQDQLAWRDRLFVTAGLRIERNTGRAPEDLRRALESIGSIAPSGDAGFGVSANPSIAAAIIARRHADDSVIGMTKLKASFGTGIKEPRLDEAFSPSLFFLGNPLLEPERATSFDVGLSQEFFNRRASAELTYFDNRFRDLIVFTSDPVTFGPARLDDGRLANFINLERASARGLEAVAAARPFRQMRIAGSYIFLRSRVERAAASFNSEVGLTLLRRPRHSGSIEVAWVEERFDISLDGAFVGRRRDVEPVTFSKFDLAGRPFIADGYAKLNASGSLRFNRFVTAFARVENLLNDDYQEILGFPAYRVNFSAGLRLRLGGGR